MVRSIVSPAFSSMLPRPFLSAALLIACTAFCAGGLLGQGLGQGQGSGSPVRHLPPNLLAALNVTAGTIQTIALPTMGQASTGGAAAVDQFTFAVELGGKEVIADVRATEVRAPGFRLLQRDPTGLTELPIGPCTTYRGGLLGDVHSRLAVSFADGVLRGVIIREDGMWIVQPLRDVVPTNSNSYVVFQAPDCLPTAGRCGVPTTVASPALPFPDSVYECELALEADYPLYQLNNSNASATQAEVLGIVNAVDVIYQGALTVAFQVTQLIVDVAPDPYTSANANTLLGQMRANWNANHQSVGRDVAHLFTGRQVGANSAGIVGLAYTATTCDVPNAYALSQTRWSPNYALRVGLTAHELGHNFGANHCDTATSCNLMCSSIGGCTGVASTFGPTALSEMNTYLQSVGCLTLVPSMPQISSASPVMLQTVGPEAVTLGGSGFLGTTNVSLGGQPLTGAYQVISDVQIRLTPPVGLSLGVHSAQVTNPAGTSNAVFLIYQGANPCRVIAPIVTQGGANFTWRLGGWQNGTGYLGVSLTDTTGLLQGFPVLNQFLTLWAGPLDARGMAAVTVPAVPAMLAGFPFYSQLVDEVTGTGTVRSSSLVLRTLIY